MELLSTVHEAEQWRHGEVQKKKLKEKGKGKRRQPWAVVRELQPTVLQREQWSLHCSCSRTVETWKCRRRRRRRGRVGPLFFNVNSGVSTVHVAE
jgi:hypothetical protein